MSRQRIVVLVLAILLVPFAEIARAASPQQQDDAPRQSPAILVAFIGGLLHHRVDHYQELAQRLKACYGDQIRVEIVFNGPRDKHRAMRAVSEWLDTDGDHQLSNAEKQNARIALFGHSYGAPAAVAFARELERRDIPVLLTIQVDDIEKFWESGRVVPANVAAAVNFYQRHGVLKGLPNIAAADPAHTKILGNFEVPFNPQAAASCKDYSRFLRATDKYHIAIECDPKVGARIEALIGEHLFPGTTKPEPEQGNATEHSASAVDGRGPAY